MNNEPTIMLNKNIYLQIVGDKEQLIFSVEEKGIIKWRDKNEKLHTVKSELDLDKAMICLVDWIKKNT